MIGSSDINLCVVNMYIDIKKTSQSSSLFLNRDNSIIDIFHINSRTYPYLVLILRVICFKGQLFSRQFCEKLFPEHNISEARPNYFLYRIKVVKLNEEQPCRYVTAITHILKFRPPVRVLLTQLVNMRTLYCRHYTHNISLYCVYLNAYLNCSYDYTFLHRSHS